MDKHRYSNSYLLWFGILFGLGGLHRLYNGKVATGLLWLCTWGLFGIGQFADLFLIPRMIDRTSSSNRFSHRPLSNATQEFLKEVVRPSLVLPVPSDRHSLPLTQLIAAAEQLGGKLSVTQGVAATGLEFSQVETLLNDLVATDYVSADNDPKTGIVFYEFREIAQS